MCDLGEVTGFIIVLPREGELRDLLGEIEQARGNADLVYDLADPNRPGSETMALVAELRVFRLVFESTTPEGRAVINEFSSQGRF